MPGERRLNAYRPSVEAKLAELLPSVEAPPQKLHEAMRYSALSAGKRLRPALCLAAADAVGQSCPAALDAACALEFVHCFSLIHDDLPAIDNDDLRRGLPTCHVVYGDGIAVLAGDALFCLAFKVLATMDASDAVKAESCRRLAEASGTPGLVAGEVLDILSEGAEPDARLVEMIHSWKTGSLIAASCAIGGLVNGAKPEQVEILHKFGQGIGLAFQIADDILNETSTAEALGKAVGSDRERSKQTYPAVFGLDAAREQARWLIQTSLDLLEGLPGDVEPLEDLARYSLSRQV